MMLAEGKEGHANKSGYMQSKEFVLYMAHFKKHSHASKDNPVLLMLDNHTSHLSVEAIDYAVEHGITMFTFPPHCTHKLQPLDVGVIGQVKHRYVEKHDIWMKSHGGQKFDLEHVAPAVEQSLDERATTAVIKSAFAQAGVWPLNPHRFTDSDFYAAQKIAEAEARAAMTEEEVEANGLDRVLLVLDDEIPIGSESEVTTSDGASTSGISDMTANLNDSGPVKIIGKKKSNRGRKPMKSAVLTSPKKHAEIKEAAANRAEKQRKSEDKANKTPAKSSSPTKSKVPKKKRAKKDESEEEEEEEDRDFCLVCNEFLPAKMTKNNTIHCDSCDRPFHLNVSPSQPVFGVKIATMINQMKLTTLLNISYCFFIISFIFLPFFSLQSHFVHFMPNF